MKIDYFVEAFGEQYPLSHALWRTFEALALSRFPFTYPLLDLGCGDGSFLETLVGRHNNDHEIHGIDLSETACQKARSRNLYTVVTRGDMHTLPYKDGTFACVLSNSVIEHIPDIDAALKEIARVLKPSGYFLFSTPASTLGNHFFWSFIAERIGMKWFAKHYSAWVNNIFAHHNLFSREEWVVILKKHRLLVEGTYYTLPMESERLWDLYLPVSYIQRELQRIFRRTKVPCAKLNKKMLRHLSQKLLMKELNCLRGSNHIICATHLARRAPA